jgi:hypothetical protein
MVQGYKQHRYFVRRGTRTVPMREDEVRAAYDAAASREERLMERLAQLPLLTRIGSRRSEDILQMAAAGRTPPKEWLPLVSVVTAPLDGPDELISRRHIAEEPFPEPHERYLGRNRELHGHYETNAFGLLDELVQESEDDDVPALVLNRVQLYREGVCEWASRYSQRIPERQAIPSTAFAQDVHNALAYFASVYDTVGYAGRVAVFVRIDNAEDAYLSVARHLTDVSSPTPAHMESINAYSVTTIDALLGDPLRLFGRRCSSSGKPSAIAIACCSTQTATGSRLPSRHGPSHASVFPAALNVRAPRRLAWQQSGNRRHTT